MKYIPFIIVTISLELALNYIMFFEDTNNSLLFIQVVCYVIAQILLLLMALSLVVDKKQ